MDTAYFSYNKYNMSRLLMSVKNCELTVKNCMLTPRAVCISALTRSTNFSIFNEKNILVANPT